MNVVFATVLNDLYVPGMVALIKSIKHHNPQFEYRFVIFHSSFTPIYGDLSLESVELLDELYDHFDFIEPNFKDFVGRERDLRFLTEASFNLDADKVIFLDADTLCIGSLCGLINFETNDIAMVCEKHSSAFNGGVIVIGQKNLNHDTYSDILRYDESQSRHSGVNQKTIE